MGPKEAIDAPALAQLTWSLRRGAYMHGVSKEAFPADLIASVGDRGQAVKRLSGARLVNTSGFGALAAISFADHRVEGAVSRDLPGWGAAT